MSKGIPDKNKDFSAWYNEIIKKADLAENSPVRGCMIIKPYARATAPPPWSDQKIISNHMFKIIDK